MATPIGDQFAEYAAAGIKRVVSDGAVVETHDLDALRRAAEWETKQAAQTSGAFGIPVKRVRMGGAYPS